jgi:hypothetical protein
MKTANELDCLRKIESIHTELNHIKSIIDKQDQHTELRQSLELQTSMRKREERNFGEALWFIHELVKNPEDKELRNKADLFEDYIHERRERIKPEVKDET